MFNISISIIHNRLLNLIKSICNFSEKRYDLAKKLYTQLNEVSEKISLLLIVGTFVTLWLYAEQCEIYGNFIWLQLFITYFLLVDIYNNEMKRIWGPRTSTQLYWTLVFWFMLVWFPILGLYLTRKYDIHYYIFDRSFEVGLGYIDQLGIFINEQLIKLNIQYFEDTPWTKKFFYSWYSTCLDDIYNIYLCSVSGLDYLTIPEINFVTFTLATIGKFVYKTIDEVFTLADQLFFATKDWLLDLFLRLSSYFDSSIDFYVNYYNSLRANQPVSKEQAIHNAFVRELIGAANQPKILHTVPLNLNINTYSTVNTHFPGYQSSTLLTITVWQYWWWMSFIIVIVLFNRLLVNIFLNNTLKIEPKVHTTMKSNGRWGDAVASVFPVFWCSNILLNSNYILRITENHTESGAFVVRIRGKQWYWVYKTSVNFKRDIHNVNLIIGRGNKLNASYGVYNTAPDNIAIPSTRWKNKISHHIRANNRKIRKEGYLFIGKRVKAPENLKLVNSTRLSRGHELLTRHKITQFKRRFGISLPARHNKYYLYNNNRVFIIHKAYKCHDNKLFVLRHQPHHNYRPYNRFFHTIQQQPKKMWRGLKKNEIIYFNSELPFNLQNRKQVRLSKIKPLSSNKKRHFIKRLRMLSTHNTLVLPTRVNITVITNSFDVVHSWFVPGLGIKFDCVPGRSTHHTLRIDKPGIYYGHCAEVCGRFHHHMPIKVIAVPLHHFSYYYGMYYKM